MDEFNRCQIALKIAIFIMRVCRIDRYGFSGVIDDRGLDLLVNKIVCMGVFSLCLLAFSSMTAQAEPYVVPSHALQCSSDFPCEPRIRRRVDFWVEVFGRWGKQDVVLHDSKHPERVYGVFNSKIGCTDKRIKKQRSKIKRNLEDLAYRLTKKRQLTRYQEQLRPIFKGVKHSDIRRAAKQIRCQTGVRDSFVGSLRRYQKYRPMVQAQLAAMNLPQDIEFLPFVESGYQPDIRSKAGAAGMWQLMPATARGLGLKVNSRYDQRLNPKWATIGATRYLVDARRKLRSVARKSNPSISAGELNPFIITSYNYGINGMRRAIKQLGPDFMHVLDNYKSANFQVAVKNFYASFLAARYVAKNPQQFFGDKANVGSETYQVSKGDTACGIAAHFSVNCQRLMNHNDLTRKSVLKVGSKLLIPNEYDEASGGEISTASVPAAKPLNYRVKRGDSACRIAEHHGVSCSVLKRANGLSGKALIKVGQRLKIPGGKSVSSTYRVKRGDTACSIAKRHGVACERLKTLNKLRGKAVIKIGQILKIPTASDNAIAYSGVRYKVRRGDALCRIAKRHGVGCSALRKVNDLPRGAIIYPGQILKLPR